MFVMLGMAAGVMLSGRRITGSCGGLNVIADADKCLVCKQSIDPDSPLRARFDCPQRQRKSSILTHYHSMSEGRKQEQADRHITAGNKA